jgi:hypothetical protein
MERREQLQTEQVQPDGILAKVIAPFAEAADVRNLVRTQHGLRAITGPTPFVPHEGSEVYDTNHGTPGGVGYFRDKYGRPHVLAHFGDAIKAWDPPTKTYVTLIGSGGVITDTVSQGDANQPPTAFIAAGNGIVIVPWLGRAYYYDGEVVAPLGYDRAPGAPSLSGPEKTVSSGYGAWDRGYNKYSTNIGDKPIWGTCQLGVPRVDPGSDYVVVPPSAWQAAVQHVDVFGNLSPLSARSQQVRVVAARIQVGSTNPDAYTYELLWRDIDGGGDATIGTVLCRTRDLLNSGDTKLYEVSLGGEVFPLATTGGTSAGYFADNVPDAALVLPATHVLPMPRFRVAAWSDERLWIGHAPDWPNRVWHSLPNKPGTIPADAAPFDFPSPVSALCATRGGVLVFTSSSTHVILKDEAGEYVSRVIDERVGCTAPATVQAFRGGAVWLFGSRFYALIPEEGLRDISSPVADLLSEINIGRVRRASSYIDAEQNLYRVFLPTGGSTRVNTMWEFDGEAWRRHDYARDVHGCCWADVHGLFAGKVTATDGDHLGAVWVIERETAHFTAPARTHRIDSAWMRTGETARATALTVYVTLRETTDDATLTLNVYRDGRMNAVASTHTIKCYRPESPPPAFDDGALGTLYWLRRRVYVVRCDVFVPSAESIKLSIVGTSRCEIVGYSVEVSPRAEQGRTAR